MTRRSKFIALGVGVGVASGCLTLGNPQKKETVSIAAESVTETKGAEQTGLVNAALNAFSNINFAVPAGFMSLMMFQSFLHSWEKRKLIGALTESRDQSHEREIERIRTGKP